MANGIYTALDQDINYLAHFGKKGMKWYQHLFGLQQSLAKYAKGAQTKGIDPNLAKKAATLNDDASRDAAKAGNMENARYFKKNANEYRQEIKNQEYNKRTRVRRALAGAASKVVGAGAHALYQSIRNANKVNRFIKNKNYRGKVISNWKKKASDFGKAIRTALGGVGKSVKKLFNRGKPSSTSAPKLTMGPVSNSHAKKTYGSNLPKSNTSPSASAKNYETARDKERRRKSRGRAAVRNAGTSRGVMN